MQIQILLLLLDFEAWQFFKINSKRISLNQQGITAVISTDIVNLACN